MLVQVAITNCLSFKEQTVFRMQASDVWKHAASHVRRLGNLEVLRCTGLFGANASGKSNFVKALAMAKRLIVEGTRSDQRIDAIPFLLDPACAGLPTRFEFIIAIGDDLYSYGFAVTAEKVLEEWLTLERGGVEAIVFERDHQVTIGNSPLVPEERRPFYEFLAKATRPNQLFLAQANDQQGLELDKLISWFKGLRLIAPSSTPWGMWGALSRELMRPEQAGLRAFLESNLQGVGTGITSIETITVPADMNGQTLGDGRSIVGVDGTITEKDPVTGSWVKRSLAFVHKSPEHRPLALNQESDGTRRILELLPALYDSSPSEEGGEDFLTVIDEVDRSLHPLLTRYFIELFFKNNHPSQLIFTSHDSNLLDRSLLEPDEIWFAEKNGQGASHISSLTEFKQKDIEQLGPNLEKGYLLGRFGAIPLLVDAKLLDS